MLKEEGGGGSGVGCARLCDTCGAAACTVYCRADAAYLCASCDARVHAANRVASRHERVWVCEACERAPAALLCKADAASLCAACDADVHAANPLAQRHQRVPILPISGYPQALHGLNDADPRNEEEEDEAASWLLPNPERSGGAATVQGGETTNGLLFADDYLELEEYNDDHEYTDNQNGDVRFNENNQHYNGVGVPPKSYGGDSVVPVDHCEVKFHGLQVGYENSEAAYSCYSTETISHSVSVSSLDIGVVPDSTMSDISMSHPRPPKGTIDLFSGTPMNMPTQLSPLEREARVLRYREKKKMRKFEKTIRYASRKAYAETRPRIKGRFAKRTDAETEVDQMFSNGMMVDAGYGIVPSL